VWKTSVVANSMDISGKDKLRHIILSPMLRLPIVSPPHAHQQARCGHQHARGASHAVPLRSHARSWPSTLGANVVVMVYHNGLSYLSRSPSASKIMVGFKVLLLLYVHINWPFEIYFG